MKAIVAASVLTLCLSLDSGGAKAQASAPVPVQASQPGATVEIVRKRGTLRCGV